MKLFRLSNDEYLLINGGHGYTGNRTETVIRLHLLGVDGWSIEESLVDLQLNQNTVAYFGLRKTFLYSEKRNA